MSAETPRGDTKGDQRRIRAYLGAKIALRWMIPVVIIMLVTKLVKLGIFKPMLASKVQAGDGVHLGWARLVDMFVAPYSTRILATALILEAVRYIFFRRLGRWWIILAAALLYVLARAAVTLHHGFLTYPEVRIFHGVITELRFAYALFRDDLITAFAVAAAATAMGVIMSGVNRRTTSVIFGVATAVVAALFGLDLAYFLSTGLIGTGQVAAFLLQNATSTWFLIRSEINITTLACILLPAFAVVAWASAANGASLTAGDKPPLAKSVAIVAAGLVVLAIPPDRLTPVYARFSSNPVAQIAHDISRTIWSRGQSRDVEYVARQRPLLFDSSLASSARATPKQNVVIVMMESIRASATQLHDPRLSNTPFLKSLAEKGASIDSMYAVEPRTSAAWISILYGIYPGDGDMFFYWGALESRHPRAISLPMLLHKYGYASAFFLPTHLRLQNDQQLVSNMGFDLVSTESALEPAAGFERVNSFGYEDKALLGPIGQWLDKRTGDTSPFLLTVMTNVGHHPYTTPNSWKSAAAGQGTGGYNDYLNSIAYIDDYLSDLVGLFSQRNLLESTIFIFLGDHGESFGEHGPLQHFGQAYEEVLHIPAVIYAPGIVQPGTKIQGLRQQIDVFPSVLSMLGIELTGGRLAGSSLLETVDPERRLYFSGVYEDTTLGMRKGTRKYLYNFERTPMEIYDIGKDPSETTDLAPSEPPAGVDSARQDMLIWRASVNRALTHGY